MESNAVKTLEYDLKTPCQDCPFRKDVPIHNGVASDLMNIFGKIEMGKFAHSCHKTDHRSDGYIESYKGNVQHCAGAIIMMKKMGAEAIQDHWVIPSTWKKIKRIKKHPAVFRGLKEMIIHYAHELKDDVAMFHSIPRE